MSLTRLSCLFLKKLLDKLSCRVNPEKGTTEGGTAAEIEVVDLDTETCCSKVPSCRIYKIMTVVNVSEPLQQPM